MILEMTKFFLGQHSESVSERKERVLYFLVCVCRSGRCSRGLNLQQTCTSAILIKHTDATVQGQHFTHTALTLM